MTTPREHLTTWIGLAVGLALAWAGWEWWGWWLKANSLTEYYPGNDTLDLLPPPWATSWWVQPAIIAGFVIVVLLCTVAGALVGRRNSVSES